MVEWRLEARGVGQNLKKGVSNTGESLIYISKQYIFVFNVYWFLHILKSTLLPHANTQCSDIIKPVDYTTSRMSLCTGLAVCNQVKKLITGDCTFLLVQKKSLYTGWESSRGHILKYFDPVDKEVKTECWALHWRSVVYSCLPPTFLLFKTNIETIIRLSQDSK